MKNISLNSIIRKFIILTFLVCYSLVNKSFGQAVELINNGNFATTNSGWTATGDFYYNSNYNTCLSCPGYAFLSTPTGGAAANLAGDINQTITIPSNATSATLSFYTYIGTLQTSSAIDFLQCYFIYGTSQTSSVAVLNNLDYTSGYVQHTYSIPSSLFGIPLTLYFEGSTDNTSLGTKFRLDDVSLSYVPGAGCSPITNFNLVSQAVTTTAPSQASFSIIPSGTSTSYQWELSIDGGSSWSNVPNNSPYSDINTSSLSINPTNLSMNGYMFRVNLNNNCSSGYSNWGTLNINSSCTGVLITSNPGNQSVTESNSAFFSASASGTTPFNFQWQLSTDFGSSWLNLTNGGNSTWTTGGTSSTISLSNTTISQYNYEYRCVISNNCPSSATSSMGILTVSSGCMIVSITSSPSNQTVFAPNSATFSADASGTTPFTFQWQESGNGGSTWTNLTNSGNSTWTTSSNSSALVIANSTGLNTNNYRCVISNSCPSSALSSSGTLTVNPVTYWIGVYTRPENNPNFPNEKLLASATTYSPTSSPIKVCADGSKATIIKLNCDNLNLDMQNIRFKLASDPSNSDPNLFGEFNTASYFSSPSLAQVKMTSPNYLASGRLHRLDTIQAYLIGNPNLILINIPIKVCRAPILFVHGLWGDYGSFQEMDNYFSTYYTSSNLITFRADYSANNGNAKSFSYNTFTNPIIATNIYNTLNKAILANFSSGKVDVVSHSMGGVLTRLHMQSSSYLSNIHTFTTINTPHSGTQVANLFKSSLGLPIYPVLLAMGRCVNCGAVDDLKYNGLYFNNGYNLNGNSIKEPSLVFTSDSYNSIASDAIGMDLIWGLNRPFFFSIGVFDPLMLTQSLYNPDNSDVIVPLSSQQGGVGTSVHYNSTTHVQAEKNTDLFSDLNYRLGQNPLGAFFNQNGFQSSNLQMPWWFFLPSVLPLMPQQNFADSIKITNPIDGSVFNTNDLVSLHISRLNGNINYLGCFIENQGQVLNTTYSIDSSLNFQCSIPATVYGEVKVFAYGLNSTGGFDYDSIYFTVNISRTLDSLNISTDSLLIQLENDQNINVDGFYSDSVTRNISSMSGMTYTILDTSIVKFSGPNTLHANNSGTTQVVANYQGLSDTVFVSVYPIQVSNNTLFSVSNNVVCGNGNVQFFDQSIGITHSLQWIFPGGSPGTSTDQNPIVNYNAFGAFDVTLITSWNGELDTLYLPRYIQVDSIPTASISVAGPTTFCQGQSVQLNTNYGNGFHYFWSNGSTNQNIVVNDNDMYTVTVFDSLGCSATSNAISTTVLNNPTPIISGIDSICSGATSILDAGSGYVSFLWSTTDTTQTAIATTIGNYSVIVTDGNGCSGSSNFTLTVNSLPTITITGSNTICNGELTTLDAGSGFLTYEWSTTETTQSISANSGGLFSVTVSDMNGCSNSTATTVTVNSIDTTVSQNGPNLTAITAPALYQWIYCDSVPLLGETNQTIYVSQEGAYSVIISHNGCIDTSSCFLILSLGTNLNLDQSAIGIYPNPTDNELKIQLNTISKEKYLITLSDLLGKEIFKSEATPLKGEDLITFFLKDLTSGIYILTIKSTGYRNAYKIVKE